jgi:hypothetical protein
VRSMAGESSGANRHRVGESALLIAAAGLGLAVVLFLILRTRGQTFYADEWAFYVRAAGIDRERLLSPHLGNLIFGTVVVYKTMLGIGGAESHTPLRVLWACLDIVCAGLVFALLRTRVGNFAALVPAVLLSVFGAAWEFFGGSLGITAMLCVGSGVGALLAIEHHRRWTDGLACLLLMISLSTLSTGIAFAVGAGALLLISPERWRRIWVVAIPFAFYVAWSLWARKYGGSDITVETLANAPASMIASLASVSAALFGAFRLPGAPDPGASNLVIFANESTGTLIGAVLAGVVIWRLATRRFALRLIPPVAMLLVYWGSLALVSPAREPSTGRYQYAAAILVLLLFAELWRDWRPSLGAKLGIAAIGLIALVPNVVNLGYATSLVHQVSEQDQAKLAVVDALRGRVVPETVIEPPGATIGSELVIDVGDYFRAKDDFGSPAYSMEELAGASISARQAADREFVHLLDIKAEPVRAPGGQGCRTLPPGEIGTGGTPVPPGGFTVQSRGGTEVTVGLRRFSENFLTLEPLSGDGPMRVRVPPDGISKAWWLALESVSATRMCPLR